MFIKSVISRMKFLTASSLLTVGLVACADQPSTDATPRTNADLQKVILDNREAIGYMFSDAVRADSRLDEEKLTLSVSVAPSGRVTRCEVTSMSYRWPALEEAVVREFRNLNLDARAVPELTFGNVHMDFKRKAPGSNAVVYYVSVR